MKDRGKTKINEKKSGKPQLVEETKHLEFFLCLSK